MGRDDEFLANREVEIVIDRIQYHDPGAAQCCLADPVIDQRLIVARIGPHQEDRVGVLELFEVDPQRGRERRRVVGREVELARTMIDIVAPEFSHQPLQ